MSSELAMQPIAIIGLAGTFPGAKNLEAFWRLLVSEKSALGEVPPHRWPAQYFDPELSDPARFYARRGGFIDQDARFEALRFGVMPKAVEGAEPDQLMTLQICAEALEDAGYAPRMNEVGQRGREFNRARCDVIIGRGGYIGPAMNSLNQRVRTAEQLSLIAQQKGWLNAKQAEQLKQEYLSELRPFGADTAIGLVPNLCASRVADRLALGGAAYTIDAACASALIAVARACESLQSRRADLALAGGVHMVHDLTFWSVFTQLGALSRKQQITPFDAQADGLLIGEGVGAFVLKRLDDALSDGDRVYAVIRGCGESSDAGQASLMSPDSQGQVKAIKQAWRGLDRAQVALIEAHGTGTPTGDETELKSMLQAFEQVGLPLAIGSVKSNIGHCMPAAGAAGLIKAALALYHGYKPASLNIEQVHPLFSKQERLYPLLKGEAWNSESRWAGVSAFGFGGINAHLALSNSPSYSPLRPSLSRKETAQVLIAVAATSASALATELESLAEQADALHHSQQIGTGSFRVALLDPSSQDLKEAANGVREGKKRQGKRGLWINPHGFLNQAAHPELSPQQNQSKPAQIAYMFPGIEANFSPRIDTLCARLGLASPQLYPPQDLGERGVSVVRLGMSLAECVSKLGIQPDQICGHSIGEWTGLITAGYFPKEAIEPFIQGLDPSGLQVPEVSFIAVGAGKEKVDLVLESLFNQPLSELGIYCSHDNCPHQSIYCVSPEQSQRLLQGLKQAQILAQELPFRSGFHAPYFEPYAQEMIKHLKTLELTEAHTPLWSATTQAMYPQQDATSLYDLSARHLVETVRFRELIEKMYDAGVRIFIQMGVGSLSSFVSDTLRGRPHRVIDAHSERHGAWTQYLNLAATLFCEGAEISFEALRLPGERSPQSMQLDLSASLIELSPSLIEHTTTTSALKSTLQSKPYHVGAHLGAATYPGRLSRTQKKNKQGHEIYEAQWPLSIERYPFLIDHCFFRQGETWPI